MRRGSRHGRSWRDPATDRGQPGSQGMSSSPERAPDAPPRAPADFEAAEPGRGRTADAPWRIPPRGWKDIAWRTWRETNRARLPAMAGGVTFYLLLATFPAIA